MTDFRESKPWKGLSVGQCDKIALAGGVIAKYGYGYDIPVSGDINEEYSCKIVNRQGMGNHGSMILLGKTKRARQMIREGKILVLTDQNIPEYVARIAVSCRLGMEIEVVKLARDLVPLCKVSDFAGGGRRQFEEWSGLTPALSFPRITAAVDIAVKVAKTR